MQRSFLLYVLFLILAMGLVLTGCNNDDDGDVSDDEDDVVDDDVDDDDDSATDDDTPDVVTAATPGLKNKQLNIAHGGYGNPDCLSCHNDVHNAGYKDVQCAMCHGANGAPVRPDDHALGNCLDCHDDAHAGVGFHPSQDCTSCHKFADDETCPATEQTDVVVIGAGGGGLGAAAYLALHGVNVTVIEQHYKVGGYMTTFQRGDYTFEISLHAMDGLAEPDGMNVAIFHQLDIWDRLTRIRLDPMYRTIYPDLAFDTPADAEEYRAKLKDMFPAEADGIDALFDEMIKVDEVFKAMLAIEYEGLTPEIVITLVSNLDVALRILGYMNLTLGDFLDRYTQNEHLRTLFTSLAGFAGGSPDILSSLFYMIVWNSYAFGGYYYFEGGSQAVSNALAEVIVENGGTIRLNTRVTKIDVVDGHAVRVHTDHDACYEPRYVISNANAPATFFEMIGREHLPEDYSAALDEMKIGLPALQIWLGVDADLTEVFDGTHEISISTSWDQDEAFDYVYEGVPEKVGMSIINYSMVDPNAAPPGKNAIVITSILPYDWQDCWQLGEGYDAYQALEEEVAWLLIDRAEQVVPGLSEHIEVMEMGTPLTMEGYTLNPLGTIFGWDNTPEQSMFKRLEQTTPIDNLYLAGAWTFPGGGQSAVIQSGVGAAGMILELEGKN